ncbi:MAG: nucleotidyl transferase AbiEii/AbiGii toxin family protein [Myxococcota bacterium]
MTFSGEHSGAHQQSGLSGSKKRCVSLRNFGRPRKVQLRRLLRTLSEAEVQFVIVGGVALIARGVPRTTEDLDIAYARDRENLKRLADALAPLNPRLRGVPDGLPFVLDFATLQMGLNFTLNTDLGPLDLLGEVAGLGPFADVRSHADLLEIADYQVAVLSTEGLVRAKRAAGRPKDLLDLGSLASLKKLKT